MKAVEKANAKRLKGVLPVNCGREALEQQLAKLRKAGRLRWVGPWKGGALGGAGVRTLRVGMGFK